MKISNIVAFRSKFHLQGMSSFVKRYYIWLNPFLNHTTSSILTFLAFKVLCSTFQQRLSMTLFLLPHASKGKCEFQYWYGSRISRFGKVSGFIVHFVIFIFIIIFFFFFFIFWESIGGSFIFPFVTIAAATKAHVIWCHFRTQLDLGCLNIPEDILLWWHFVTWGIIFVNFCLNSVIF